MAIDLIVPFFVIIFIGLFSIFFGVPYYFVYQKLIKGKNHKLWKSIIWIAVLAYISLCVVTFLFLSGLVPF